MRVMPIWTVERKRPGFSVRARAARAPDLRASAIAVSRARREVAAVEPQHRAALADELPLTARDGGVIRPGLVISLGGAV